MQLRLNSRLDNYNPYQKFSHSIIFTCHGNGPRHGPAELIDFMQHKISKHRWWSGALLGLPAWDIFCRRCKQRTFWCPQSCCSCVKNSKLKLNFRVLPKELHLKVSNFPSPLFPPLLPRLQGSWDKIYKSLPWSGQMLIYSSIQFPKLGQQLHPVVEEKKVEKKLHLTT